MKPIPADKVGHYAVCCQYCDARGTMTHTLTDEELALLLPLGWTRNAYGHYTCSTCQGRVKEQSSSPWPFTAVIDLINTYQRELASEGYSDDVGRKNHVQGMIQGLEVAKRILREGRP